MREATGGHPTIQALIDAQSEAFLRKVPLEGAKGRLGSERWSELQAWLTKQNRILTEMRLPSLTAEKLFGMRWVEDETLPPGGAVVEERPR